MKKSLIKNTQNSLAKTLLLAGMGLFALSSSAEAVVTVTFSQSGSDVIAVLSGSLDLAGSNRNANDVSSDQKAFSGTSNFFTMKDVSVKTDYYMADLQRHPIL